MHRGGDYPNKDPQFFGVDINRQNILVDSHNSMPKTTRWGFLGSPLILVNCLKYADLNF